MPRRSLVVWGVFVASLVGLVALGLPRGAGAQESTQEPPGLAEPNPTNPPFVRRWKRDRLEDWYDRREDVRDRREDIRDRREDRFDRREDIRDRRDDRIKSARLDQLRRERHEALRSGDTDKAEALRERIHSLRQNMARDRREDVRDRREDKFDRREDRRDRRENWRDRREDWRDGRYGSPGYRNRPDRPRHRYARPEMRRPGAQHRYYKRHALDRPARRHQPTHRPRFGRYDRPNRFRPQMADRRPNFRFRR